MKLQIGEKIKELRRQKGITQEQLAEILGLSCQSVSRWEIGTCYPDIELLPVIANYFDISMDALMGMDDIRSEARRRDIFTRALDMEREGKWDIAVETLREAAHDFPGDDSILSELALALSRTGNRHDIEEAIDISERVLNRLTSDKIRATVRANLCFLYNKAGLSDRAAAFAATLPHIWECREMLMPDAVDESKRPEALERSMNIARQVLGDVVNGRGIMFSLGYRPEKDVDISELMNLLKD